MENTLSQTPSQDLLPWHKPEVQQLVVSIDTRIRVGSGEDLVDGENP